MLQVPKYQHTTYSAHTDSLTHTRAFVDSNTMPTSLRIKLPTEATDRFSFWKILRPRSFHTCQKMYTTTTASFCLSKSFPPLLAIDHQWPTLFASSRLCTILGYELVNKFRTSFANRQCRARCSAVSSSRLHRQQ